MNLTRETFELLATHPKYDVRFTTRQNDFDFVEVSVTNGVYYKWNLVGQFAVFQQKISYNSGVQSWNAQCGMEIENRIKRDLAQCVR